VPLSSESYRRMAGRYGYRIEVLEKVARLGELLQTLDSEPKLADCLALRGGTTLNLEVASPSRLSVDLDLDFVGAAGREEMLAEKPGIMHRIQECARSLGYRVSTMSDAHAGSSLKLDYANAMGSQDLLKVDVSWTNRVEIEPRRRVALWQPEPIDLVEFTLVGRADLIAGKFRALVDRVAARDVFDAVRIADALGGGWPAPGIKNAFVFISGTLDLPLTAYSVSRLDRLTEEDVNNNLLPMLAPGSELDRDSLVDSAKRVLAPLLDLEPHHRAFVEALDRGDLRPDLIFPPEDADRLARHPHLVWKVQNRRSHLNSQP